MSSMIGVICQNGEGASLVIASMTSFASHFSVDGHLCRFFANCKAMKVVDASAMTGLVVGVFEVQISIMLTSKSQHTTKEVENEPLMTTSKAKHHWFGNGGTHLSDLWTCEICSHAWL